MKDNKQRGAVTVEACVSVLTFVILMLMLSSLFIMFLAQNVTAHVVLQTSESLSIDAYRIEKLMKEDGKIGSIGDYVGQFVTKLFGSANNNPSFVTDSRWYQTEDADLAAVIKMRFVGYLTGSDDEIAADEMLRNMNIVDGLSGLDFSASYIADNTLYIVLRYEMEYDFNIFGLGKVPVEQTTCSKLWM